MKFLDIVQGSDMWHQARKGIPTSSNFDRIITPKTRQYSKAAQEYIAELIGETFSIYGPERPETYTSNPMRHGQETEEEARRFLAMEQGITVTNGGFCIDDSGRFGASPDGRINEDAGIELKCPTAKVHTSYLLKGGLPEDYLCQVMGQLYVTKWKHVLFCSYHPGLPIHIVKVFPDPAFMDDLAVKLEMFHADLTKALERIKAM